MTDALPAPSFNEDNIRKALIDAQGDLFVAAQLMGHVTVMALNRAIRACEPLQRYWMTLQAVKALPEYDRASTEQLQAEITRRLTFYRADALESLHQMATMEAKDAGEYQVKLAAASRLAGPSSGEGDHGKIELAETLRALNERYQTEAPRIKMIRTTVIEVGPDERTIEDQSSSSEAT